MQEEITFLQKKKNCKNERVVKWDCRRNQLKRWKCQWRIISTRSVTELAALLLQSGVHVLWVMDHDRVCVCDEFGMFGYMIEGVIITD